MQQLSPLRVLKDYIIREKEKHGFLLVGVEINEWFYEKVKEVDKTDLSKRTLIGVKVGITDELPPGFEIKNVYKEFSF